MTQRTLTEEKLELRVKLMGIIAKLERAEANEIALIDIIPIAIGLKVIYEIAWDMNKRWSRIIKYSDLANEN